MWDHSWVSLSNWCHFLLHIINVTVPCRIKDYSDMYFEHIAALYQTAEVALRVGLICMCFRVHFVHNTLSMEIIIVMWHLVYKNFQRQSLGWRNAWFKAVCKAQVRYTVHISSISTSGNAARRNCSDNVNRYILNLIQECCSLVLPMAFELSALCHSLLLWEQLKLWFGWHRWIFVVMNYEGFKDFNRR